MNQLKLLGSLIALFTLGASAHAQSVSKVTIVRPERKLIRQIVEQPATLEAIESTPIFTRVSGYIERLTVDMGDKVQGPEYNKSGQLTKPGQTLAVLSLPELTREVQQKQASVAESRSQVEQAYAAIRVSEAKVKSARTLAAAAEAGIRRSAARLEKQQSEFERLSQLAAREAVARKVADEAREAFKAAQADHDEAGAQLEAVKAQIAETEALVSKAIADRATAEARVKVMEATLEQARTMLDFGSIHAPFTGVVSKRSVHTGHFVQSAGNGPPLFEITRLDTIRVLIDIPESFAALIDVGDPVAVRFPSASLPAVDGQITRLSWTLDKTTRTLRAEFEMPNPSGTFRPGMYAYASIVAAEKKEALVLPLSAIIAEKQQQLCATVESGRIVRKEIKLGLRNSTEVEITAGLLGTELIVRSNAASLAEGQIVDVVAPVSATKP